MRSQLDKFQQLLGLGYITLKNNAAIQIYKHLGFDYTFPIVLSAQLNNACNSRCNMCDVWRQKKEEIAASLWITALKGFKNIANYKVGFAGGEVLLKDDVFEIFKFCHQSNIPFGITTNGYLLNPDNIERLLKLNPININISIDSLDDDVYQRIRGVRFLKEVKSNIEYLMTYVEKHSVRTKIFFKTVVNNHNLTELHLIANYANEKKVAGITFDPIRRRRKIFLEGKIEEFEKMINVDQKLLQEAKYRLVRLKDEGFSILNSKENIDQWFNERNNKEAYFCSAPLSIIYINSKGEVRLCDFTDTSVGNIIYDDIRTILRSKEIRSQKRALSHCQNPCVYCIQRNLADYRKIFYSYLKH
jgi:MoaA/NifB/PqqE/SkfB family radical SAM enzyme